ncbi:aminoglycoside phosphotransferase [Nocardioides currus]|uniref:Aminoglycoside phosphotransferase n=1 Tax=Nocardioides currus TaxID=2133958 RepID=A0A2R7YSM1_9ACTN|nr:aminoglycoside phosphotransferase [Nocardioides currus]PUA79046.1 aminoglycoside phosphotransferase [Nocardioides currus]
MDLTTEALGHGARVRDDLPPVPTTTLAALLGCDADQHAVDRALDELVTASTGRHPRPGDARLTTVAHSMGSPATGGVYRVSGTTADGSAWSLFCKLLQHVRHWPDLRLLPPHVATHFADSFPWRSELELWDPVVQASLPQGLRSPRLARVVELPEDRVAVWQEDVGVSDAEWDDARFARAAHLLGRWNARSTATDVLAVSGFPPGFALRMYAEQAVAARGLVPLRDDGLWGHPWLVAHRDLASRLTALGERIPALLDRLDSLTQALPHGDASPQNLLVPAHDDAELVVIDVSFRSPHVVGFDLGQLLVGLVHADVVPASRMPAIAATIVPAYVEGLAAEGLTTGLETVPEAFATSALLRSGFDGFLYGELAHAAPADAPSASFTQRIEMTRFLVDQFTRTVDA